MMLVAGLGMTGQSVLRYLDMQGQPCLAFDTRTELDTQALAKAFPKARFAVGKLPDTWLGQFDTVVLSPGIAQAAPWVRRLHELGKTIIGDIELFARAVGKPVVAITGSNGKSSVATLTGLVLSEAGYRVAVGGNIGEPALDCLTNAIDYDIYVLELSSFQLETTYSLTSTSATVLNICADHMDRYDSLEAYSLVKAKVYDNTELAVVSPNTAHLSYLHKGRQASFSLAVQPSDACGHDCCHFGLTELAGEAWLSQGDKPVVALKTMLLQGTHHQLNALAVMALCHPFAIEPSCFQKVFSEFKGLAHRTEQVLVYRGVSWVNDSKGTNVGATLTALESLGTRVAGKVLLIAGGVGKEADFSALASAVKSYCRQASIYGQDQQQLKTALQPTGVKLECVDNLAEAVALSLENAKPGDCVLFSPACASFDQYANYIKRGEHFVQLVHQACEVSQKPLNRSAQRDTNDAV